MLCLACSALHMAKFKQITFAKTAQQKGLCLNEVFLCCSLAYNERIIHSVYFNASGSQFPAHSYLYKLYFMFIPFAWFLTPKY